MIQVQSWLTPSDNSGASSVECIKTLGGFNRKISYPGDFILISVKQLRLIRKVRVGQIHMALFVRSRKDVRFLDGSSSSAEKNAVILMNKKQRILGTRFLDEFLVN
jgi:large subunit ribosomal protein L14